MIRVKAHRIRVEKEKFQPGKIIAGLEPAEEERLIEEGYAESVPSSDVLEEQTSIIPAAGALTSNPSPFLQMLHQRWRQPAKATVNGQAEDAETPRDDDAAPEDGPNTFYPELSAKDAKKGTKQAKAATKKANPPGKSARGGDKS